MPKALEGLLRAVGGASGAEQGAEEVEKAERGAGGVGDRSSEIGDWRSKVQRGTDGVEDQGKSDPIKLDQTGSE